MKKNELIRLSGVAKSFDNDVILKSLNLSVNDGEFVTLLGPSGCGKTTTLRIIGGFEKPDAGDVFFASQRINDVPPNKRNINTVFQKYALFPHLNVAENIAFGLNIRKVDKKEVARRVEEMLELVNLKGFGRRSVASLSGGQQQRVAIARAVIQQPKVLLLDEPLGALDLKLRKEMQVELKNLHETLNMTFIYVTHDQEEAINMSDRIAVMNQGTFEQIGTPDEIYNHPQTSYVATFVGNANILKGTVEGREGADLKIAIAGGSVLVVSEGRELKVGKPVTLAVRSENLIFDENCGEGLPAEVIEKSFAGGLLRVVLKLADGTEVVANRHGIDAGVEPGQKVTCSFAAENAVLVDLPDEAERGAEV